MRRRARGAAWSFFLFTALPLAACGGPSAKSSSRALSPLPAALAGAFEEEATGDAGRATSRYLAVLDDAAQADGDSYQVPVLAAALDALVWRSVPGLSLVSDASALVYRRADGSFATPVARGSIAANLAGTLAHAGGPFAAGLVARTLEALAVRRGDAAQAAQFRALRGCALEAAVVGPLAFETVTGVTAPDPLAAADAPLGAAYETPGPFGEAAPPVMVRDRGCALPLAGNAATFGVRDVVVDVEVKEAQAIGVALRTRGTALLRAGGLVAIGRPYELGGAEVVRFARVDSSAGTLRLVARVAMDEVSREVEVSAWDASGRPLRMHAPAVGSVATARATAVAPLASPSPREPEAALASALGALATGEVRAAEQLTYDVAREDPSASKGAAKPLAPLKPALALAHARAVEQAIDLMPVPRDERARAAYEQVLAGWPSAWEAILAEAVLAGNRRGEGEAYVEMLKEIDGHRSAAAAAAQPWLDAFDATVSGRDKLWDRARAALVRAQKASGASPLVHVASEAVFETRGAERTAVKCANTPGVDRGGLDCYDALTAQGSRAEASAELARVRTLLGASSAYASVEARDALGQGDLPAVVRALSGLSPGERPLSLLYATRGPGGDAKALDALRAAAPHAPGSPSDLLPLLHHAGSDPAAAFDALAETLAAEDRAHPVMPGAATAVLKHVERHELDRHGLLHSVLFDLRRVSGTSDVEENAQATPPAIEGRLTAQSLRRRIFKKDGRVLEPDRAPNAAQGHADLSQLEQGDTVEAVYEAYAVPESGGNLSLDTPDLLPERTAVHDASVELQVPAGVPLTLWAHPRLGKATEETREGGGRTLTWQLHDAPARRLEEGTPRMDRDVAVSFSTATWDDTARGLRETLAALEEHDAETSRWAREAVSGKTTPRAQVEALVEASGKAVHEASSSPLTDFDVGPPSGPQSTTARTVLTNQEGSRTWLLTRALRELGIATEVVLAEDAPYSANPAFPAHAGRFTHPLARVSLPGEASPLWVDADVSGPPLPVGRLSPELRGRSVLHPDGTLGRVPDLEADDERDEVDLRLALDSHGDAKGSLTILLRGRSAQELAEALVRLVGDERQRALRGVALGWVPFANVDDVQLSSSEGSWQVAVRAALTLPGYAQREGAEGHAGETWVLPGLEPLHAVFPRPAIATLGATYATRGARSEALAVNQGTQYHVHRRLELPPAAHVVRVPGAVDIHGPLVVARRNVQVSPGGASLAPAAGGAAPRAAADVVEEEFALRVQTGTVAASAYGDFVGNLHRIDDAFLASTRVKPGP